jgi:hypothetical protein
MVRILCWIYGKDKVDMKWMLRAIAILLALPGLIFALQGANILPGSVMTGQTQWLIIGSIMIVIAAALWFASTRAGEAK